MEKQSAYDLIYLGLMIRHLQNLDQNFGRDRCIEALNDLEELIEKANLFVSLSAFQAYIPAILKRIKKRKLKSTIGADIGNDLNGILRNIERTVYAESRIKEIFTLPQRRYNTEYLNSNPLALLNQNIASKLPELAISDFSSACRCLLYGESTACAFHILRTVEEVLRHYYSIYFEQKQVKKKRWAEMTKKLRDLKEDGPDETILDSLDLVRDKYRNPTQHPDATYDIDSAQDLFGLCIDLINKMAIKLEPIQ